MRRVNHISRAKGILFMGPSPRPDAYCHAGSGAPRPSQDETDSARADNLAVQIRDLVGGTLVRTTAREPPIHVDAPPGLHRKGLFPPEANPSAGKPFGSILRPRAPPTLERCKVMAMHSKATDRILRLKAVLALTGLTRSTLYRKMNAGTFPASTQIGTRCIGWRESAVTCWLDNPMTYGASRSSERRRDG